MSKLLAQRLQEARRLIILQLIASLEARRIDLNLLRLALRDLGHETEKTVLQSELRWLGRQALIDLDERTDNWLARLTERGDLAQRGEISEPGVARPELP